MFFKFLDPKNDVAFKKIFGTEKNKDILIHFLNDMITFREKGHVQDVTFLKNNQDPEIATQKTSYVDILCKDEKGHIYIVEMQVARDKGFEKRAQYYASKAYCSQTKRGEKYEDLKEVIFLAIADFVMFPNKEEYKSDHAILDKKSYENDLQDFSFTFVELPKFDKDIDQLSNMTDKWCYFFKHAEETSKEDFQKLISRDPIIERAYKELDHWSWDQKELQTYEDAEKRENSYYASMAQKFDEGIEKGKAEGLAEGIEKGKAEGLAEGIEKGKAEGLAKGIEKGKAEGLAEGIEKGFEQGKKKAAFDFAKQMLEQGTDVKTVVKITNLSEQEIDSIS